MRLEYSVPKRFYVRVYGEIYRDTQGLGCKDWNREKRMLRHVVLCVYKP